MKPWQSVRGSIASQLRNSWAASLMYSPVFGAPGNGHTMIHLSVSTLSGPHFAPIADSFSTESTLALTCSPLVPFQMQGRSRAVLIREMKLLGSMKALMWAVKQRSLSLGK